MFSPFFLIIPGLIVIVIITWFIRGLRGKDQDGNAKVKEKKDKS